MGSFKDITGQRYGRWFVLKRVQSTNKKTMWLCRCDCGTKKAVESGNLKIGKTKSCGCLERELAKKRLTKHGKNKTRLHRIWVSMRTRCTNPKATHYDIYGGRGITTCKEWSNFIVFENWALDNGYADDLSIDRIDVNCGYYPDNCRWANNTQQARNRNSNHKIAVNGEDITVAELAERCGIYQSKLSWRLKHGFSVDEAITQGRVKRNNTRRR